MTELKQRILPSVQKPARYTGGEWGEIQKRLEDVRVRVAFCFPDTYEIGMSNVGMRILYGVMNRMVNSTPHCPLVPIHLPEWGSMESIPLYPLVYSAFITAPQFT